MIGPVTTAVIARVIILEIILVTTPGARPRRARPHRVLIDDPASTKCLR